MPMPTYLYHATPKSNALSIASSGLQPRSVGGEQSAYLCMSGTEKGATTLRRQASDIIFRVRASSLNTESWSERGAGKLEWRCTEGINATLLEYRRYLGTETQTAWRVASLYPVGM